MRLDANKIPKALIPVLPMAEKWGIGDDFEREEFVKRATRNDLEQLVHCIDQIDEQSLYGWLGGSESFNPKPTAEYLAFTCLTMAIDSAKIKLRNP